MLFISLLGFLRMSQIVFVLTTAKKITKFFGVSSELH